jgi:vitamin B12 transporter
VIKSSTNLCASASLRGQKFFTQRRRGAEALLLVAAMVSASAVQAQTAQEGPEEPQFEEDFGPFFPKPLPEIVVTATGAPQPVSEVSAQVTQVIRAKYPLPMQAQVSEILATVPGVNVARNGGVGGLSAVRIRGAEGDQTLVLIDGVRVNDPSATGGAFDFGQLLAGNIERVEVFRGPNSVPWGSQAIGGVINIMLERPAYGSFAATGRAEYGSNDAKQLTGNIKGTTGILGYSLGAGWFAEDGISAFKDGTEKDGFRQYAANGGVELALTDHLDVDLRAYYVDGKTQIDGFLPPAFGFADTAEFSTYQQVTGYAGVNLRLFNEALKNKFAFTLSDINRDNFDAPNQAAPSFLARGRSERMEYQGDAEFTQSLRGIFGIERELTRFSDGFSSFRNVISSGYAQLVADPVEQITLTGGIRLDDHRRWGSQVTLGANIVWRPGEYSKISLGYGEGFKAPSLFQLNSFFGNLALQPEQAKNYEIGVEQKFLYGDLTATLNLFQRDTTGQIDFISCFGQTNGICTNRPFGTYDNIDRTRAKGLEFILNFKPTSELTVDANYSLIDAKGRDTGFALVRRPKHNVNANVDWQIADKLRLGAGVQWHSAAADIDFQTFGRTKLDSYALFGLRAVLSLSEEIELYARVENIFDAEYETVSGYGTYGRNAHIGVRAKF